MPFDDNAVAVFLAVLDHGSFSAAARALGRVPSAVSMSVGQLEAELDLLLFDRSGREPRPTAAALSLEPQARSLAAQRQQLQVHALALTQGLEDRLTIVIAPELLATPWAAALAELAAEYPLLEVEVLAAPQADALAMLHDGRAQLALVFERSGLDSREGFQEVTSDLHVAVVSPLHPMWLKARQGAPLRDAQLLSTRQIVVASRDRAVVDPRFVLARHRWRTDTPIAAMSLIVAGLGWGWLPRNYVQPQLESGQLVELKFENLSNKLQLCVDVVWSKARPLGLAARRFVEHIGGGAPSTPA